MADALIYRTIPEQIEEHLRRDILTGVLVADEPLREQDISKRFGVSRGPVREVLMKLTQQGLVVSEPNKGVRVAPHASSALRPLVTKLRRDIEVFVLESIFADISKENIKAWSTILDQIHKACKEGDKAALVDFDLSFHKAIIQRHDDKDLFTLWHPIMLRMLMSYDRFGDDLLESYKEHKRILDAIKNEDKKGAIKALKANIQ